MANIKKYRAFEILICFVLLFFAFVLQTTDLIFTYNSPSPSLVLSLIIVVSFYENYLLSSIFGLIGGILIDTVSAGGYGFFALMYMLTAFICNVIIKAYLQNNFASLAVIATPVIIINMLAEAIFKTGFSKGIFSLFFNFYIIVAIYTFVSAFLFYLIFRYIIKKDEKFKKPKGII